LASPSFFAIGELGGGHSSAGAGSQTMTSVLTETVDLTQLSTRGDLILGLYDGAAVGGGFTSMTFDLTADGVDVADQTFTSTSAAETYFDDDAIDLGSLASGQTLGADTLSLTATLTITTDAAGSGFYGDLIIGDPPKATSAASAHRFIAAAASFSATAGRLSGRRRRPAWGPRPFPRGSPDRAVRLNGLRPKRGSELRDSFSLCGRAQIAIECRQGAPGAMSELEVGVVGRDEPVLDREIHRSVRLQEAVRWPGRVAMTTAIAKLTP
jgi:hypothetical protein